MPQQIAAQDAVDGEDGVAGAFGFHAVEAPADLDGDGIVEAGDIAILLGEWGEWGG